MLSYEAEPEFSWCQPNAGFPEHPEVQKFLRGPTNQLKYGIRGLPNARKFANTYFGPFGSRHRPSSKLGRYSATACEGGIGSSAFVTITKTKWIHEQRVRHIRVKQAELNSLKQALAKSEPRPPSEGGPSVGVPSAGGASERMPSAEPLNAPPLRSALVPSGGLSQGACEKRKKEDERREQKEKEQREKRERKENAGGCTNATAGPRSSGEVRKHPPLSNGGSNGSNKRSRVVEVVDLTLD
eukprot:1192266-Prorocentrum_minimum.AAC.3